MARPAHHRVGPDGTSRSAMLPITNLSKGGRRIGAYIEIPLGIRNANALLLKQSPDLVKDLALHVVDAVLGVLDPEPQLEFDRGLAMIGALGAGAGRTRRG